MPREHLQNFVQQFDQLNALAIDNFCDMLVKHLCEQIGHDQYTLKELHLGRVVKATVSTLRQLIYHSAVQGALLNFGSLNAHGLNKIGQTLLVSIEDAQDKRNQKGERVTDDIMLEALIDCMRRIRLELAKEKIEEVKNLVEDEYRETSTPMPVEEPAESIYAFRKRG